jgi:hypothetical protein
MTKNTKIMIGVGVGVLLLLWLRNRNQSTETLKEAGAGAGEGEGATGGSGGEGGGIAGVGGITPNALGGATPVIAPVVMTAPVNTTRPLFRPLPSVSAVPRPAVTRPAVSPVRRPSVSPVANSLNTSFARFDGSFRSPSGLDFDGHIEN